MPQPLPRRVARQLIDSLSGVYAFKRQTEQYASVTPTEPGVVYFKGLTAELPDAHVDCLLYYDKTLALVGILNHYPVDTPWEKAGNINTFTDPALPDTDEDMVLNLLWQEALARYGESLDGQTRITVNNRGHTKPRPPRRARRR